MKMPKLLVEIILENGQRITKKCQIDGEHIVIKKGAKGFGGKEWAPRFSKGCIVTYFTGIWPFKQFKQKLVVKDGAEECIDFSRNPMEIPSWTRRTAEKFFQAEVLKKSGQVEVKANVPLVYYLGLALIGITLLMVIIGQRGIRI